MHIWRKMMGKMGNCIELSNDAVTTRQNGEMIDFCLSLPSKVNTIGWWSKSVKPVRGFESAWLYPLPMLELQILAIFSVIMFLHFFLKRLGFPVFVSQIIAGLLLGPSWRLNVPALHSISKRVFYIGNQDVLGMLSMIGYSLFVFLIGVKMDITLLKNRKIQTLIIGILSVVVPALIGCYSISKITHFGNDNEKMINPEVMVWVQSLTSYAAVHCLLEHLSILNSELGRMVLTCSLVADLSTLSSVITSNLVRMFRNESVFVFSTEFGKTFGFLFIVVFVFHPTMQWIVRSTPNGTPVKGVYFCAIIMLVLLSSVVAETMDQAAYFGPFILGLAVPEGPPLGAFLVNKLDGVVTSVFLPLFVTVSAIKVDFLMLDFHNLVWIKDVFVLWLTSLGKIGVCFGCCLYFKMPFYDSLALGLIMSCKGILELAICSFSYDNKSMDLQTYPMMVIHILILSILIPTIVKFLYDPSRKYAGYRKRNIFNLRPNSDLKILTCFHSQNDVASMIALIDATCPTSESHVSVYALHLVELVGRAMPVFMSHQVLHEEKSSPEGSVSSNIIQLLRKYKRNNRVAAVSIEAFTAISPMKMMYEDVCTVAMNKRTSLVILPFHRRWTRDGILDSDDGLIRNLNCRVLDRAPCSVGIFIDRDLFVHPTSHLSGLSESPLYQVAVIFIGGNDDREALSFARRMKRHAGKIVVTVIRLVTGEVDDVDDSAQRWDNILDTELLNKVKYSFNGGETFRYMEKTAEEGSQTAKIVRSIVDEYDLIIVGRRHGIESPQTSGLMEWNEFPELGIVGDLLASSDFNLSTSVLIIQQQQQ